LSDAEHIKNVPSFSDIFEIFLSWPTQTQLGIVLFAVTWLVGGNILMYFSMKRRGIPFWKILIPSFKTTFGLNGKEYLILGALAVSSLAFAAWGINAQ